MSQVYNFLQGAMDISYFEYRWNVGINPVWRQFTIVNRCVKDNT